MVFQREHCVQSNAGPKHASGTATQKLTNTAVIHRCGARYDAWLVGSDRMTEVHTFGRNLERAAETAREAIAVTADVPDSTAEFDTPVCFADVDVVEIAHRRGRGQEAHGTFLLRQRAAGQRLTEARVSPRRDPIAERDASANPAARRELSPGVVPTPHR